MDDRTSFGARSININFKRAQEDIFAATRLMTRGFPESLTEFRAYRSSKRPGAVAISGTAANHAAQLNEYEVEEAAEAVEVWFPCCDAGSKRAKSAMLVRASRHRIDPNLPKAAARDDAATLKESGRKSTI